MATGTSPQIPRIPWSLQEDEELKKAVAMHGDKRWSQIATYLPGRTSKACSHRWRTYLQPGVMHASCVPFTDWEKAVVKEAHKAVGNNWAVIARMLPGRTNAAVKNFWYSYRRRAGKSSRRPSQGGYQAAAAGQQPEAGGSSLVEEGNDHCGDSDCDNLDSADGMDHDDDAFDEDFDGECDEGCADHGMAMEYSYEQDQTGEHVYGSTGWQVAAEEPAQQAAATPGDWLQANQQQQHHHQQQQQLAAAAMMQPPAAWSEGGVTDRASTGGAHWPPGLEPAWAGQLPVHNSSQLRAGYLETHPTQQYTQMQQHASRSCEPRRSSHHSWSGAPARCIQTMTPVTGGPGCMTADVEAAVGPAAVQAHAAGPFGSSGGSSAEGCMSADPVAAGGLVRGNVDAGAGAHPLGSPQLCESQQFSELYCRQITTTTTTSAAVAAKNEPVSMDKATRAVLDLSAVDNAQAAAAAGAAEAMEVDRAVAGVAAGGADRGQVHRHDLQGVRSSEAGAGASNSTAEPDWTIEPRQVQELMDVAMRCIQPQHTMATDVTQQQQLQLQQLQQQQQPHGEAAQEHFKLAAQQFARPCSGYVPLWESLPAGNFTRWSVCSDAGTGRQPQRSLDVGSLPGKAAAAMGGPSAAAAAVPAVSGPGAVVDVQVGLMGCQEQFVSHEQQSSQGCSGQHQSGTAVGGSGNSSAGRRFLLDLSDEGLANSG